ncbi:MAG TPA: hypothetical protein VIE44_01305 [Methylomirabilota bacterium]|jgi:molybdopterin molybdotransferase
MPGHPSPFRRFVAIDWSGAREPAAQRRAIVRCVIEQRVGGRRVTCLQGGRDRRETVAWLADLAPDGVPTLAGLDFPFAYAAPFLDHLGAGDFAAMLERLAPLHESTDAPERIATLVEACGRWWTRCRPGPDRHTRRQVECLPATRGAESPLRALRRAGRYDFVGARQVGKAALTGIAAIAALKTRAPSIRVWPFEDPAGAPLVLAEIWPRLALGRLVKSAPAARRSKVRELDGRGIRLRPADRCAAAASDHAIDALAAAAEMALGGWPLIGRRALPREAVREGWILGVRPPSSCRAG